MTDPGLPPTADLACCDRTRSAVVNVLVGVSLTIALSGLLLRWRDQWAPVHVSETVRRGMLFALFAIICGSLMARRIIGGRPALHDPGQRATRFFRAHLLSALIAALASPLGLVYAWTTRPLFKEIAPFWSVALALGFLALPRASELEGFDVPLSPRDEAQA